MLYELTDLTKQFKDRQVLDIDALCLKRKKVYALIGPNGAGKTTLLNQLALLEKPTSGSLTFLGRDPWGVGNSLLELRRKVVLVDQSPILFSGTVRKNVEYGLQVRRIPKDERDRRVAHCLHLVGMDDFINQDVHGLSGGEVKRVALARALAIEPEVLLCDEPTANVDEKHQEVILRIIEEVNQNQRTTIIFSTHFLSQSRRLADQTIILRNGRISSYRETKNSFMARVVESDSVQTVVSLSDSYQFSLPPGVITRDDRDEIVHFQIDPNELAIGDVSMVPEQGKTINHGVVKRIASEQDRVRITVDIGISIDVLLDNTSYRASSPLVGDRVALAIPSGAVTLKED
ncbi:MAG: ATP-binding cassette domain-containing protein [Desulfobulbaceae bacterium]|nr:MAG: ATP-binding cassette domain-containing protein [Desulfobulbaceae bacterium]